MSKVRTVFQPPSGVATRFLPIAFAAALLRRPVLRLLKTTFATFVLPIEGIYNIAWRGRFWNHISGRSGRPNPQSGAALPSPGSSAHIAHMAKTPKRDPAKHSKKDRAKPTRAKAARPDLPPIDAALAKLLNPAIERGEAGPGSQTGLTPPPDNSFDRRADFSAAHRARKSTQEGFGEAQQRGYVAKTPSGERTPSDEGAPPGELDPDLARVWGIDTDDDTPSEALSPEKPALPAVRNQKLANEMIGSRASQHALDALLREGRPEFAEQPWVPHRPPRPEKSEGGFRLVIKSEFEPKGDQPQAIDELVEGVKRHDRTQVLLGVTGSGKTFTMAKVIERTQRPALILAPNKTLAAQLYGEFRSFFPDNAVEYFVSYYDYYQPEAYVPRTDTYIEKESSINEQIDRMRHAATRALLERDDVIIVASVSCIYGIGSVE